MGKLVLGLGIAAAVLVVIAAVYALGGLVFMLLWNFLMPTLWHAAPHLSWLQAVAASWLIGIAQSIFGGGVKIKTKE